MRIIDSHTHITNGNPEKLLSMAERYGYERLNALSIPCNGLPLNNLECLLLKKLAPERAYVYGGITYLDDVEPTAKAHREELELLVEAGCDGWKLLESKPSVYRRLRLPLDGPIFDAAFAFAEETGLPIIWHAGDPATFWDEKKAPSFAIDNHWLCVGKGFPTLGEIYRQVENVFTAHPNLRATLAHLYFTSDNMPYAEQMFARFPNLWMDLTPGSEMYWAFMEDRSAWTDYFLRHQDRLVFGTDMVDEEGDVVFGSQDVITDMVLRMLTENKPFSVLDRSCHGLGLPGMVLNKMLADNFEVRNGQPKPLNEKGLARYADWLMQRLNAKQKKQCEALLKRFALL